MPEMLDFEGRFERRLQAYASIPVRPVDADTVAHAVIAAPSPRFGLVWPFAGPRRAVLALTLLAAALLGAVTAGYLLLRDPVPPGAIVFGSTDGLDVANHDGSQPRTIRDDGRYHDPRWSPGGDYIAVIHRLNEVLVLRPDGTQVGRWGLTQSPGDCCPIGHLEWTRPEAGQAQGIVISFDPRRGVDPGFVIDTAGTKLLERRDDGGWTSTDPRSRDLSLIVYAGTQDDVYGIWAFDPAAGGDGRARLVTEREPLAPANAAGRSDSFNEIAVSPDGTSVAFIQSACGFTCAGDLRIVRIEGGEPTLLDDAVIAGSPLSFAADGRSLMATLERDGRRVPHVVPLDGSAPEPLPAGTAPGTGAVWWHWSGGGTRLLGTNVGPNGWGGGVRPVFAVDPATGAPVRVVDGARGADVRPLP